MSLRIGVNLLTCNLAQCPIHWQATDYCLRSLLDSDLASYDWQLQIVDNGSTCQATLDAFDSLEEQHSRIWVKRMWENLGIAKARNRGYQLLAERHQPAYMVEVHSDHFFPRDWLRPLVEFLEAHSAAGIVGSGLFTESGFWHSPKLAVAYQRDGQNLSPYEVFRRELERSAQVYRNPRNVRPGLSHPAVRRWAMVEALGERNGAGLCVYDPELPGRQNFEDTEEAFRAHRAGWQILIHHGSYVYHHYHFSRLALSDHPADYDANNLHCQVKHGPEFVEFVTRTLGGWMTKAYRR